MSSRKLVLITLLVLIASLFTILPAGAEDICQPPACEPPRCDDPPGVGTPGYWMNHPEAWRACYMPPEGPETILDELPIGCKCDPCSCSECCLVPKGTLIEWMRSPVEGNKVYTMVRAVVAAKLNRLAGNNVDCINPTIIQATQWLVRMRVEAGGLCETALGMCSASDSCWQDKAEGWYELLDAYNNGELCAPSRDLLEGLLVP